jgi:hypothetical protein
MMEIVNYATRDNPPTLFDIRGFVEHVTRHSARHLMV